MLPARGRGLGAVLNPLQWINDKLAEFQALPMQWLVAIRAMAPALAHPDPAIQAPARQLADELIGMNRDHARIMRLLKFAPGAVTGLGAGPVVIGVYGATAAAVVAGIVWLFRRDAAVRAGARSFQACVEAGSSPESCRVNVTGTLRDLAELDRDKPGMFREIGAAAGGLMLAVGAALVVPLVRGR